MSEKKWYNIINYNNESQITIYQTIGKSFFQDGYDIKQFYNDFKNIKSNDITIRINSAGGNLFEGLGIYSILKQSEKNITTIVDGFAASIASVIFLAGKNRKMAEGTFLLIHNPSTISQGNKHQFEDALKKLNKITEEMVQLYVNQTNLNQQTIRKLMDQQALISASEALEWGFADEIIEETKIAAQVSEVSILNKYHQVYYKTSEKNNNIIKNITNLVRKELKIGDQKMKISQIAEALQCKQEDILENIKNIKNENQKLLNKEQELEKTITCLNETVTSLEVETFMKENNLSDDLKDSVYKLYETDHEALNQLVQDVKSVKNKPKKQIKEINNETEQVFDFKSKQGFFELYKIAQKDPETAQKILNKK